jgi:hypothetical protein
MLLGISSQAADNAKILENLSENADVILTGKVTEKESHWNDAKTRIYTRTTVRVDEYLKGSGSGNVNIIYPGGEVGDVGEIYTHMPTFETNEEVLVFLRADNKSNQFKVLNGEEGKLTVIEDTKTNEKVTTSNVPIRRIKSQIQSFLNQQ